MPGRRGVLEIGGYEHPAEKDSLWNGGECLRGVGPFTAGWVRACLAVGAGTRGGLVGDCERDGTLL